MSRNAAPEDLLVRARRQQLDDADERRLELSLSSSRELSLLYEAGVGFDAEASVLPGDEARAAQHGQLLGEVGGFDADLGQHLGDGVLALAEQFEHADARGVAEGFEELRLDLVQGPAHRCPFPSTVVMVLILPRGSPPLRLGMRFTRRVIVRRLGAARPSRRPRSAG